MSDDRKPHEQHPGAVFWVMLLTGLSGQEAEMVVDGRLSELPKDRQRKAKRSLSRVVLRNLKVKP